MTRLCVLVACEFSGTVRDAFQALGHDAWSCDLLENEGKGSQHIQGDAIAAIKRGCAGKPWHVVIAHPPCTFLANSGVRWLYTPDGDANADRWNSMREGAKFFADLWTACEISGVGAWAFENPVMHKHAREEIARLNPRIPAPVFFQPWEHGHPETKRTGLWLQDLPPLKPTCIVEGRTPRVHFASPGPDRWKERSRTLRGVARAIAEQFSNAITA